MEYMRLVLRDSYVVAKRVSEMNGVEPTLAMRALNVASDIRRLHDRIGGILTVDMAGEPEPLPVPPVRAAYKSHA